MFRYTYQIELVWWQPEQSSKLVRTILFTSLDQVFKYWEEVKSFYTPEPQDFRIYVDRQEVK